jgi:hypothetical protein
MSALESNNFPISNIQIENPKIENYWLGKGVNITLSFN